jgi:hypothetical protein
MPKNMLKPVDKIIPITSKVIGMKINITPQDIHNPKVLHRASK